MVDPLFWLGLSILLVAVSLAAVLIAALPALQELARAARSAEKLFDTLSRELPPTLESIRLTGMEITTLTEDVNQNVQAAGRVVEQLDQSITSVKQQARQAQVTTRSVVAGFKAAWQTLRQPSPPRSRDLRNVDHRTSPIFEQTNLLREPAPENPFEIAAEADLLEDEYSMLYPEPAQLRSQLPPPRQNAKSSREQASYHRFSDRHSAE